MRAWFRLVSVVAFCAIVVTLPGCGTACGGTSGKACGVSGAGGGATPASFSSWASVAPNTSITVDGTSQSGTYTYDVGADRITGRTIQPSTDGATYTATYDGTGKLQTATVTPVGSTAVSFARPADTIATLAGTNIDVATSADGTKYGLAANPFGIGWDYQSFGIWTTGAGTGSGTFGAISIGAATAGSAIPTIGTATYIGFSGGRYVSATGTYFFTYSDMTAAADFVTRSITFTTTGTQVSSDLSTVVGNANLNMTGALTYAAATNQITGPVSTTGGLTGTVNGRFFGPIAQEIGGTFSVENVVPSLEGYAGAFGGKK